MSLVAAACLDFFFYPPYLTLNITDPQDWVALGAFEEWASKVVQQGIFSRTEDAAGGQLATYGAGAAYELSRSALLINLHQPPGLQLAQLICTIFSIDGTAIFDANAGKCDTAGVFREGEEALAKECYFIQEDKDDPLTGISVRVLRNRSASVGAIAISGTLGPLVTDALASLAAITLDRCVSFEKEIQIERAHQSERSPRRGA